MKFNLEEECKEVKVSELSNGGSHFEFFLKDDSRLKELFEEKYKDTEPIPLDAKEKLKEIWCGNMFTFHT